MVKTPTTRPWGPKPQQQRGDTTPPKKKTIVDRGGCTGQKQNTHNHPKTQRVRQKRAQTPPAQKRGSLGWNHGGGGGTPKKTNHLQKKKKKTTNHGVQQPKKENLRGFNPNQKKGGHGVWGSQSSPCSPGLTINYGVDLQQTPTGARGFWGGGAQPRPNPTTTFKKGGGKKKKRKKKKLKNRKTKEHQKNPKKTFCLLGKK